LSNKPPAFQLYAADFYMDIIGWSNEAVGAYLRLLLYEWVNGPIPNDIKILRSASETSPKRFPKVLKHLKMKFLISPEGRWYNPRLEQTRKEQEEYRKSQQDSGRRGAEIRWKGKEKGGGHDNGDPISDPNGVANGETMALQSSSSSSSKKNTYTPDFEAFWKEYPKKAEKADAFKAWKRAESRPDIQTLLKILAAHKNSFDWKKDNGKYVPYPARWINRKRWEDDILEQPRSKLYG